LKPDHKDWTEKTHFSKNKAKLYPRICKIQTPKLIPGSNCKILNFRFTGELCDCHQEGGGRLGAAGDQVPTLVVMWGKKIRHKQEPTVRNKGRLGVWFLRSKCEALSSNPSTAKKREGNREAAGCLGLPIPAKVSPARKIRVC
jgi:hypothetical protein